MSNSKKTNKWKDIPNDNVLLVWKCPNGKCEDSELPPTFFEDNGTPSCECGEDMKYTKTIIKEN